MESNVVYEFTCRGDPNTKYIGYTNRTLEKRVKEHVSGGSAVSDHISVCNECNSKGVTINDFVILHRSHTKQETMVHEALAIKEKSPVLNKNLIKPGLTFTLMIFWLFYAFKIIQFSRNATFIFHFIQSLLVDGSK